MKGIKFLLITVICLFTVSACKEKQTANQKTMSQKEKTTMKIQVENNQTTILYKLNESDGAKQLYEQLPLKVKIENFNTNEKIFYPPKKLDTKNTPMANAKAGTLAYYAPWGNIVMFYGDFGKGQGLYELGNVISGKNDIQNLKGTITTAKLDQ